MNRSIGCILLLSLVLSCTSEDKGTESIRVENSGVYTPISIKVNDVETTGLIELGEYVTSSNNRILEVKIKNNTKYPMTDLDVIFVNRINTIYDFYTSGSSEAVYPGENGSCERTLKAGRECKILLSFYATKSDRYSQKITIQYKNLVEPDSRTFTFSMLAGQPASLILDDGSINNFFFGTKVGAANKPVLERSEVLTYERELILINMGELTAKGINIELPHSCSSFLSTFTGDLESYSQSGFPAINFCDAWLLEHSCPESLAPLEGCALKLSFTPKNQDQVWGFDEALDEVQYSSSINTSYISTPDGDRASLRGNFETYSTTIGARFATTKKDIKFADDIVVGNFISDIFQVKNNGYREGVLKNIILTSKGVDGVAKAVCLRTSDISDKLECFDETLTTQLTLEQFPFIITERNDCFTPEGTAEKMIAIDESCILDFRFQPSLKYTERKTFSYTLSVVYDSKWKGNEVIIEKNLFDVESKSLHAGVLKIANVEFDSRDVNLLGASIADSVDETVDLKRLALLSEGYETWRPILITFQNIGGTSIDVYKAFSGVTGGEMGLTELSKTFNSTVGNHNTKYFKDIKIDQNNCGNLGIIVGDPTGALAGSKCILEMQFAPISMTNNQMQNETMFDRLDTSDPMKIFSMSYHDGSNFSDLNTSSVVADLSVANNAAYKDVNVGIKAQLIEKGFLADFSKLTAEISGGITRDNEGYLNLVFRNIGTGPISWIPYIGDRIDHESSIFTDDGVVRVSVSDPATYDADYDCNDVFDFDGESTDVSAVNTRIASKSKLAKLQTCVLRVRFNETINKYNESNGGAEVSRLKRYIFNQNYNNTETAYSFLSTDSKYHTSKIFDISFYDGDGSGRIADGETDPIKREFGELFETETSHLRGELNLSSTVQDHAKLFISDPKPYMSSVIYRPEISLPALNRTIAGGIDTLPAAVIAPEYFTAKNIEATSDLCNFNTSCFSPTYVESSRAGGEFSTTSVDYIYHAGSFNVNREVDIEFSLAKSGNVGGMISAESLTGANEIYFSSTQNSLNGISLGAGSISAIQLKFLASNPGIYTKDYSVTYTTGRGTTFVTQTLVVRVVARALVGPKVLANTSDFDADGILSSTKNVVATGLNHSISDEPIAMEAVQVATSDSAGPALKKRVYIKNDSLQTMNSLTIDFGGDPTATTQSNDVGANFDSDKVIRVFETTCIIGSVHNLAAGQECSIDFWYQPLYSSTAVSINIRMLYDTSAGGNQYVQENLSVSFKPLSPSELFLVGSSEQNLRYRDREEAGLLKSGQKGFVINTGDSVYDVENKQFVFTKQVDNDALDTRASLLRQFEKKNTLGNSNYGPSDITFDSDGFVQIYSEGTVDVAVNSICLFGGTVESSSATNLLGFNSDTVETCNMRVAFKPGINVIGRNVSFTKVDDVSDYYFYLEYYNNKRDSFDKFFLTFTGKFEPPASSPINIEPYSAIEAFGGSEIQLTWSEMNPSSLDLGPIVGYRVYYSKFSGELGTIFDLIGSSANYEDVSSGSSIILNSSYIQDMTSYYFQIVAIRENAAYTGGLFDGLGTGKFLSLTNEPILKITVPSVDMFYSYEQNALISFNKLPGIYDYFEAQDGCINENGVLLSDNGGSLLKRFELINQSIWDVIEVDFLETSYYGGMNPANIPHWINEGLSFDIDTIFQSVVGYDPNKNYQRFEGDGLVFIRSSEETVSTYGSNVAKTEGGIFNFPNYDGYLTPTEKEGFARCFISLD